ncbi:MAG TPA: dienelactone hydrolase family protein [Acidimicrobiales bacterium]|nr:dienelactone hydrolase family protein [Acidimicrobiales bacterium]
MHEAHTLSTRDGEMGVHVVRPDADGPFATVVFFHHGPGLDDGSKQAMQLLADAGYYVISHDRYHREAPWYRLTPEMRNDQETMQRFFGVLTGTTEDMVDTDLQAVFAHVDADPAAGSGLMGCIGYCIGARSVVVMMARHNERFAAGAAMHPSYCTTDQPDSPHLLVPSIAGTLYVAFGSEDKMQSPEDNVAFIEAVRAMPEGRGDADILDGANHGFAVPGGPAYHEAAASVAYDKTLSIFGKVLS